MFLQKGDPLGTETSGAVIEKKMLKSHWKPLAISSFDAYGQLITCVPVSLGGSSWNLLASRNTSI